MRSSALAAIPSAHTLALGHTRELQPFTRHCYSLRLWPPLSSDLCQTLVSLRPKCSDTSSACPHRLRPAILAPGLYNCMFSTSRPRATRHGVVRAMAPPWLLPRSCLPPLVEYAALQARIMASMEPSDSSVERRIARCAYGSCCEIRDELRGLLRGLRNLRNIREQQGGQPFILNRGPWRAPSRGLSIAARAG